MRRDAERACCTLNYYKQKQRTEDEQMPENEEKYGIVIALYRCP